MRRTLVTILLGALALGTQAQPLEGLSAQEIERRNAAVGFVQPQAAFLGLLRIECAPLLPGEQGADAVARRWWERNRDELDPMQAWQGRYVRELQRTNAAQYRAATAELLRASTDAMTKNIRMAFRREAPSPESCRRALQRYEAPELDIRSLAKVPGYEQFGEFAETLQRIRTEPEYMPPSERSRTFETQVPLMFRPIASLDAADSARERKDGEAWARIYTGLAQRGDGKAAQTLGLAHYRGDLVPQDGQKAYAWFWRAYALGHYEGLNSMATMWRDGQAVPRQDQRLAYAAFLVAANAGGEAAGATARRSMH